MTKTTSLMITLAVLLHLLYASILVFTGGLVYLHYFVAPNWKINFDELNAYNDSCHPSTTVLEDLVIPTDLSLEGALKQAKRHGSAIIRDVITTTTLEALRELLLKTNTIGKGHFLIELENRAKQILGHRQLVPLLKELGSHSVLRPLLEGLLGPAASLVALDTVTAYPGALAQDWHQDTSGKFNHNRSKFVKLWAITIPLQNTTSDMGATGICPGTHECERPTVPDTSSYQMTWIDSPELHDEYDTFQEWMEEELPFCQMQAETNIGDVFLYNSDMYHKGEAHVDPNAMDRAVLFVTFAESRTGPNDDRLYPPGYFYNMAWNSWGHTLDNFDTLDSWWPWEAFGLFNSQREGRIPWNIFDFMAMIWMSEYEQALVFHNADLYTPEFVEKLTWHAVKVVNMSLQVYVYGAMALLAVYVIRSMMMKVFGQTYSPVKVKLN